VPVDTVVDHDITVPKNIMGKLSSFYHILCCEFLCKRWVQCCGICSLAQEGREIRNIVMNGELDYLTFESYKKYSDKWIEIKNINDFNMLHHFRIISCLSKNLLKLAGFVILCVVVFSFLGTNFRPANVIVFLATILQACLLLFLIHWNYHKYDLSIDALIKYFASGFLFSTSTAVIFELIFKGIIQNFLSFLLFLYDNDKENYIILQDIMYYRDKYPSVILLYLFFIAFGSAAFVEEICKYYGYKMIEHPDFLTSRCTHYFNEETTTVSNNIDRITSSISESVQEDTQPSTTTTSHVTLESKGWAITLAMVSTAIGFACCENLMYIFSYSREIDDENILKNQWITLLGRSLFPVHPICAGT